MPGEAPPAEPTPADASGAPRRFDGKAFAASLPRRPGVYRMFAADGQLLYVGKAAALRDRVGSYFNPGNLDPKVQALVSHIASMQVTVTQSETDALILEYNLIKEHKPRYNIVLRDDKSFPYIWLTTSHAYPRISSYRGSRNLPGRYFGPFPNASAVWETLQHLQKVFKLRNCRDSYFSHRSRPCLQHQIGRCTAPCVGLISQLDYARDVATAIKVLEGHNNAVNDDLAARMQAAAETLDFEAAARLRDQLAALKEIQAQQVVAAEDRRDVDVFAIVGEALGWVVCVMRIRGGRNLGTSSYFPKAALASAPEALVSFIMQYYAEEVAPTEVFANVDLPDAAALAEALALRSGSATRVHKPSRGMLARWVEMAVENAQQALRMRLANKQGVDAMRAALAEELQLSRLPERMECFDVSHTQGEGTIASCVVFGADGPLKKDYRRFNIAGITPGDDYAALRQALERRYQRIRDGEFAVPDLLLIDGGAQQIAQVHAVLEPLGFGALKLIGVSKGPDRRPGQERIHIFGEPTERIPGADSLALKWIQRIRDEAHRFAITGHRRKRAKRFNESVLEAVAGLGPAKRRALLTHFGGLQGVMRAAVADLAQAEGIGAAMARTLYDHLHPGE